LRNVIEGDEDAWEEFVKKYSNIIYSLCVKYAQDYDERMDMFLYIFKKIREKGFKRLREFKEKAKFTTYLYKISLNLCIDFLRSKKRKTLEYEFIDNKRNPDEGYRFDIARIKIKEFIEGYIESLKGKEKNFLELFYKGEKIKDAAHKAGIENGYYVLKRILKDMREKMEKEFSKDEIMEVLYGTYSV